MKYQKEAIIFMSLGLLLFVTSGCKKNNENQLYFEEAGTGQTIIFIHGTQEDYSVFMPQLQALKDNFHVITYSRRYNYPNSCTYQKGVEYNPFTEAVDLELLINSLNVEKVNLVGHSYGGLIAMVYTHKNPGKVKNLILSEPPLLKLPGCEEWYRDAQERLLKKVGAAFETNDTTVVMKAIFEFFVGTDLQDRLPSEVLQSLKANLTEMKALVNSNNPFPDLNMNLKPPIMLITTGNTMPMLNCTNKALLKKMPIAMHFHIPDASHDMWVTHPKLLAQYTRDFLFQKAGGEDQ